MWHTGYPFVMHHSLRPFSAASRGLMRTPGNAAGAWAEELELLYTQYLNKARFPISSTARNLYEFSHKSFMLDSGSCEFALNDFKSVMKAGDFSFCVGYFLGHAC
jgi:hypothetical protein